MPTVIPQRIPARLERVWKIANALGMSVVLDSRSVSKRTHFGYWTGKHAVWSDRMQLEACIHEMSHYILSSKRRRSVKNFGLGLGGRRARKVSPMLAFWEESLAETLDISIRAFFNYDAHPEVSAYREDLWDELTRMKLISTKGWPNWSAIFARCGKEFDSCVVK